MKLKEKSNMLNSFNRNFNKVRCYNCQIMGQLGKDCIQPNRALYCPKCKAKEHTTKYCTMKLPEAFLIDRN